MATLVAIGYPEEGTAEQARGTVWRLEDELIIEAEQVASVSRDMDGRYHVPARRSPDPGNRSRLAWP